MNNTNVSQNSNTKQNQPNYFAIIMLVVVIGFCVYKYVWPKINTSWVVDAACTEVKSQVYSDYGEIPSVSGSILYKNGQDYIVVVSYDLREIDWEGKIACHVYGYRKSNCYVTGMTREMPDDYRFNIEELKALWSIE